MVFKGQDGAISWQYLTVIMAIVVATSGGAIWLGSLSNQIMVNTSRLGKIDGLIDEIRQHDANTTARWQEIDRRLSDLENFAKGKR